MYVNKNFSFKSVMIFSGGHIIWITVWVSIVAALYKFANLTWLSIPWLPLSLIGTAVAFYIGFKNNQAYDRLWEARKIWGALVNSSRAWGSIVKGYISNQFRDNPEESKNINEVKKKLIYRHIAYLYALRNQLLIPAPWEHINQNKHIAKTTKRRMKEYGKDMFEDDITEKYLEQFLPKNELEPLINFKNTATQIIDFQSQNLAELRAQDLIDDFRHMEMQNVLNDFYVHQGKAERIKKFPLPRQYGSMSFIFVAIFIFLLPFGMISEFAKLGEGGVWLSIPFTVLVSWVYLMMELVGDYSENPFEGLGNDIPMLSLCRVIEIDLREMIADDNIPKPIEAKNGTLM
ncbi:MAG: putative membrane protein [Glaciecola sp.]|jgi:putative membrane protein